MFPPMYCCLRIRTMLTLDYSKIPNVTLIRWTVSQYISILPITLIEDFALQEVLLYIRIMVTMTIIPLVVPQSFWRYYYSS